MMHKHAQRYQLLAIFCGGFLGTLARYGLSMMIQNAFGKGWPLDILLINITGALILAFVTTLADTTMRIGLTLRLFINVGFLGAYTTFSSLALGDVLLYTSGNALPGLLYLFTSITGGLLAISLGSLLARRVLPAQHHQLIPPYQPQSHLDIEDDLLLTSDETSSRNRSSTL